MYLRICMKTKFCQLHFRGRSTLHKIGQFYLSDHGRQPHFGQNAILARSKAKIRNWKIINCFFIYMCQTLFTDKNEGKLFLVPKSSGPLLPGLPLNSGHVHFWYDKFAKIEYVTAKFSNFFRRTCPVKWILNERDLSWNCLAIMRIPWNCKKYTTLLFQNVTD